MLQMCSPSGTDHKDWLTTRLFIELSKLKILIVSLRHIFVHIHMLQMCSVLTQDYKQLI